MKKSRPLNIVGFDDRSQKHPPGVQLPEWMPMHEFFMLIVAPAGSGKTTLILNLLLRIYKYYFHRIIVFSPTIHNDQKWKHVTNQKHVLRPNPYRNLWQETIQEDSQTADPGPQTEDISPEEKEWLKMQEDTFLLENFKDKKGSKKRLGSTQFKLWKQLAQSPLQVTNRSLISPHTILERKRRVDRLTALLVKPTPPLLAQQLRDYHALLNLPPPNVFIAQDRRVTSCRAAQLAIEGGGGNSSQGTSQGTSHLSGRGINRGHSGVRFTGSASSGHRPQPATDSLFWATHLPQPTQSVPTHYQDDDQDSNSENEEGQSEHVEDDQHNNKGGSNVHYRKYGKVSKKDLHEEYNEQTLEEAMQYQDKVVKCLTNKKLPMTHCDHLCWVFDDMVGSGLFNQRRNNAFKRLSVRRRHFCSSVIGVVQAYKEFPKTSRTNCNVYILFRIDNEDELESIYKDFPCGLTWPHWKAVYDYCTREPYSFMMINTQVKDPKFKLVKNFDEPLFIPLDRHEQQIWVQQFIVSAQSEDISPRRSKNCDTTSSSDTAVFRACSR